MQNARKLPVWLAILVMVSTVPVCADQDTVQKASTPQEIAAAVMEATQEARFADFAKLMHPEALAEFRNNVMPIFNAVRQRSSGDSSQFLQMFGGVASWEALDELSDSELFANVYSGAMTVNPQYAQMVQNATMDILGTVAEGQDTVHVLSRLTMNAQGNTMHTMEVTSVEQFESHWRCLLTPQMQNIAAMLMQVAQRMR
jgi:hypothetical protein